MIYNKIIENNMEFYITEANTETIPIFTSSYFFYQTDAQTYNDENLNTRDIFATTPETTMSTVRLTFTCKK